MIQNAFPPTIPGTQQLNDSQINNNLKLTGNLNLTGIITASGFTDGTALLTGGTLSNLLTPIAAGDATNKAYVDSISGGTWKGPVRVASVANIASISGLLTIDDVTLVAGNRVLLKNQTTGTENGIYVAAVGIWSRSTDLDTGASAAGVVIVVNEGTTQDNFIFQCINDPGFDVVGTDSLIFIQFGSGGGTPGGANTQIQFNNAGSFGGSANLTWNGSILGTAGVLNITNTTESTSVSTGSVIIDGGVGIDKNIFCGGDVSAVEFLTTSDAELKKDVRTIQDPLRLLDLIDPIEYRLNFTNDDTLHYGVLAQDLQEQGLNNLVKQTGDHLSVNYNDLIGILLGSVQQLQNEIKELKKYL